MIRKAISSRVRGAVMARSYVRDLDRFICNWCCARLLPEQVVIDHIIPVASGGSNDIGNLTVACRGCNSIKSDASPFLAELRINAVLELQANGVKRG